MALVEIAAVADGGRPLCQACYKCEADAPLVFKAYDILSKLKTVIREEDQAYPWTLLQDAAEQGAALMKIEQDNFDDAIHAAEMLVDELKEQLGKFTFFQDAVRLVVLVQASSARVERVFSLFKYIMETCQDHALADQLQLRLFTKVNSNFFS